MFVCVNEDKYREALDIMREEKWTQPTAAEMVGVSYHSLRGWMVKNLSQEEYNELIKTCVKRKPKNDDRYKKALEIMRADKCTQETAAEIIGVSPVTLRNWLVNNLSKEEFENIKKQVIRRDLKSIMSNSVVNKFKERFNHKKKIYNIEIMDWAIKNDISIPVIEFKPIIISMGKEFLQC